MSNISTFFDYRNFFTKMMMLLPALSKAEIDYWMSELGELSRRFEQALKPASLGRRIYLRRYACLDIPLTIIGPRTLADAFQCDSELSWGRMPDVPWNMKELKDWNVEMKKRFADLTGEPRPVLFLKDFPEGICTSLVGQLEWPHKVVGNDHIERPEERLIPDIYHTRGIHHLDNQQALLTATNLLHNPIPASGPKWEMMYLKPPTRPANSEFYRSHQECVEACAAESLELATVEETLAMLSMLIGPMRFLDRTEAVACGRTKYWTATPFGDDCHLAVEAYLYKGSTWLKLVPLRDDSYCNNLMAKGFRPV